MSDPIDQRRRAEAEAQCHRGIAELAARSAEAALACFERALEACPDDAATLGYRGLALADLGCHAEALASYDQALVNYDQARARCPDLAETLNNRGNALWALGRPSEALASYGRALGVRPDYVKALNNRGHVLLAMDDPAGAEASLARAVELDPKYAQAWRNRAQALDRLDRREAALDCLTRALSLSPGRADYHVEQADLLLSLGRHEAALEACARALALDPALAEAHYRRGQVLRAAGRYAEAVASHAEALRLDPRHARALNDQGIALRELGRREAALANYARALEIDPEYAQARWNAALCALQLGRFETGWRDFEARWRLAANRGAARRYPEPPWLGETTPVGKTLLLHAEQGLGDTLQFCRYVPRVAALGARVVLEVEATLLPLMASLAGVAACVARDGPLPEHDLRCPLMSLPLAFRTDLASIPADIPYLAADPARLAKWSARIGPRSGMRVGLAWRGNPAHQHDGKRSLEAGRFLAALPKAAGIGYYSLQKNLDADERARLGARSDITLLDSELGDFADTAAVCELLDLVISVDTGVAHLADALGRPVWVLLPWNPDWRWLLDRADSPWYPTARLYRQERPADWHGVLARLGDDLPRLARVRAGAEDDARGQFQLAGRLKAGRFQAEALAAYTRVVRYKPDAAEGHVGRGIVLRALGHLEAARMAQERALALNPGLADAHVCLGNVLADLGRYAEALDCHDRALATRPDFADAHLNRGNVLYRLGRLDAALGSLEQALALRPDLAGGYGTRGLVLADMGRFESALTDFERAIALRLAGAGIGADALPAWPDIERLGKGGAPVFTEGLLGMLWNRAMALLQLGRFREGWREFECRRHLGFVPLGAWWRGQPTWLGDFPLTGRRILLHAEQGLGDVVQFCRYAPWVARQGGHVLLGVDATLRGLLARLPDVEVVSTTDTLPPDIDCHCPLMSLPLAFGTELATIPAEVPYLHADPVKVGRWAARLGTTGRQRVGLVWRGNPGHKRDAQRSLALRDFLAGLPAGIDYFSLQQGMTDEDRAVLAATPWIRDCAADLADLDDTAALCMLMDRVVSVDTSVAHLAGALGRPVAILLPFNPDWRWLLDRDDSPWYPTARLYRQTAPGDWPGVLRRLRADLERAISVGGLVVPSASHRRDALLAEAVERHRRGDSAGAEQGYRAVLALEPNQFDALHLLGVLHAQAAEHHAALDWFDAALAAAPANAEALYHRGNTHLALGDAESARRDFEQVLERRADHVGALRRLADMHRRAGTARAALDLYRRLCALAPGEVEALYYLGTLELEAGHAEAALACLERACARASGLVEAHYNRALALKALGRHEDARAAYDRVIELDPAHLQAYNNRGNAHFEVLRLDDAEADYRRALALDPEYAEAHTGLAFTCLLQGRYREGWREYEWRWRKRDAQDARREFASPPWHGTEDLAGRVLFVASEQGLGDTLQFCRYAARLAARGARVILEALPSLKDLLASLAGVDQVIVKGAPVPAHDYHCHIASLAYLCDSDLDDLPGEVPYLGADARRRAVWSARLGARRRPRVGLVWRGNPAHKNDRRRSMALAELLAALPEGLEVDLVSLQVPIDAAETALLTSRPGAVDAGSECADFADTAAVCELLDLVLCVDTSVAHLAGALGQPVWLLLPHNPDWRWGLERDDSPWYPTARLFRQTAPGDWHGVAERVRAALEALRDADDRARQASLEEALSLHRGGHLDAARQAYRRVLAAWDEDFDALHMLGVLAAQAGDDADAMDLFTRALNRRADPVALANRAALLRRMGRDDAALDDLRLAADLAPADPLRRLQHADLLLALGRDEAAVAAYADLLAASPDLAEAHYNQGIALRRLGRRAEALDAYARAIAHRPEHGRAHNNRGNLLRDMGRREQALADYRRAIDIDPRHAEAHANLGLVLTELGRLDEALPAFARALELRPEYAEAYNHRAMALAGLGRRAEALADYERALALQPEHAGARQNRALLLLQLGRFDLGWREHEWRWRKEEARRERRDFAQPLWLGDFPPQGRTMLLHGDFGLGDALQFCRYVARVAALGARVVLEVQAPLVPLMASLEGVGRIVARGDPLPEFDCHCPLMSLPLAFKTDLASIPSAAAYLHADPQRVAVWRERLGPRRRARVGIVWSGNAKHGNDRARSLALADYLQGLPDGADYYALQKTIRRADRETLARHPEIVVLGEELRDFADTAGVCMLMDLIVSVDTSVAHLAGALGRPVWILLPFSPDWRWLLDREDSPWYPSARLFRQSNRGDWASLLAVLRRELSRI